jgi:ATP-dependent 26S proteasome regulatory subunit
VESDHLLRSLRAAVEAAPDDIPLRLHYAELLAGAGDRDEAVRQAAAVLQREPANAAALALISGAPAATPPVPVSRAVDDDPERETLRRLDAELDGIALPRYVESDASDSADGIFDVENAGVRIADVGGMTEVKARLEAAVLAPLRNPELLKLYGKSLRGGLLLYGPPGCGKTFIARAIAGEIDARFISVSLADILDMYIGNSERNIHALFEVARANAPCVVFLDEVDAIGQKRSQVRGGAGRGSVNQLLTEMDGMTGGNDGVYVLGATNHPWDVDTALRRPGRFDRMVLVLPPDEQARDAILRYHLRNRPIAGIDTARLAKQTDGYSGADLAYVCESAAERALLDSARTGTVRMIGHADVEAAVRDVRPSIGRGSKPPATSPNSPTRAASTTTCCVTFGGAGERSRHRARGSRTCSGVLRLAPLRRGGASFAPGSRLAPRSRRGLVCSGASQARARRRRRCARRRPPSRRPFTGRRMAASADEHRLVGASAKF